jgi:hypothetical protein
MNMTFIIIHFAVCIAKLLPNHRLALGALGLSASLSALACSSDSKPEAAGVGDGPVYALMIQVQVPDSDDRTVYAVLSDTLDLGDVTLDQAREFSGVANFGAIGGKLYVSSGEEPRIDRFEITDELGWRPDGAISFANYGLPEDGANIFSQWFVDEHTAYLSFDVTRRIVWDPANLAITNVLEDSTLELSRGELTLTAGGNRAGIRYDGPVLQPFFYHDEDWLEFAPSSPIAGYDPLTHEEHTIIDAPCSGLAVATRDEQDNTYFSTWDYSPGRALFGLAPPPCTVRVGPDLTLDEAWTTDMTSLTEGRLSINFRYLENGKGLTEVLHDEEFALAPGASYDPSIEDLIWEGGAWRLWHVDLDLGQAWPVEGIEPGGNGLQVATVDDRTFLLVGYEASGNTVAYELDDDGSVTERFRTPGEAFKWIRVR